MNKEIFQENLLSTIIEIKDNEKLCFNNYKFIIEPIDEPNKPLNGTDDMMRLILFSEENIGGKKLPLENTINLYCGLVPLVPIWINISYVKMNQDTAIFKLQNSLRFRKPTLLRNVETGHPPFRALFNHQN
ncbi:hypothetical protein [Paenibacillus durus]|nr:hypothetical protein [Paenibacillus durus]